MWIIMRLKLMADAGLVGLPNAGKSTFLSSVSRAKPKVADYPFTTIHPQLGVVGFRNNEFVLADIPGLIEGAHEGAGIGDRFLGHVERTRVLLHLVSALEDDVAETYRTVRTELAAYGDELAERKEIIALSKIDTLDDELTDYLTAELEEASGQKVMAVSSATGKGVQDVLRAMADAIAEAKAAEAPVIEDTRWQSLDIDAP